MPVDKGGGNARHRAECACFACAGKKKALALAAGSSPTGLGAADQAIDPALTPGGIIDADILEAPGRTMRGRIAEWIMYRRNDPALSNSDIAKKLGIATSTLNCYISKAHKEGWLKFSDPMARLEHEITPQIVDNLAYYLSVAGGRDKQVTIEAAKGMVFKQYLDSKGVSEAPQTVLALKIETVAPDAPIKVGSGNVVGAPRVALTTPIIDITPERT